MNFILIKLLSLGVQNTIFILNIFERKSYLYKYMVAFIIMLSSLLNVYQLFVMVICVNKID